jgi:hypothetical protein
MLGKHSGTSLVRSFSQVKLRNMAKVTRLLSLEVFKQRLGQTLQRSPQKEVLHVLTLRLLIAVSGS